MTHYFETNGEIKRLVIMGSAEAFPPQQMEIDPIESERLWNQIPESKEFDGAYADDDNED